MRGFRVFASSLGLAGLIACSGETGDSEVGAPSNAGGTKPQADRLFSEPEATVSAQLQSELERRDAGVDGWPTEVMHDQAKASLKSFLKHLCDTEYPVAELAKEFSTEFEASHGWMQAVAAPVRNAHGVQVARADLSAPARLSREEFLESCARYRELFADAGHAHADLKIFSVLDQGDGRYVTRAYVQTAALDGGAPLQVNHQFDLLWQGAPDDEHALLQRVDHLAYEEIRPERALFADLTEATFSGFDFFDEEFRLGAGENYRRIDRLVGNSYMGWQGIAIGDVDGNGLEDLYVCQPGGVANRLFLRQANGQLRETAVSANVAFLENTRSALLLDLDNDGDQDLVLASSANLVVAYNDGRGNFSGHTPLVCGGSAQVHSLTAADVDLDGDLDVYACRYNTSGEAGSLGGGLPVPYHDADNGGRNILWRNDGRAGSGAGARGVFTDATAEFGLDQNNSKFSLAAVFEDFDADGDLDLYVTNDFGRNNYYINEAGKFSDAVMDSGLEELAASMGATVADYDRDGDFDIYLSNMFSSAGLRIVTQSERFRPEERDETDAFISHARGNFLLQNDGAGNFVDQTEAAQVELGRWAWGARFVDFDNDGFDDIYVPNGFVTGPDTGDL